MFTCLLVRYVISDAPEKKLSKAAQLRGDDERQRKVAKSIEKTDFKSGVDKEGWLTKSGSNGRSWKKRWCVLKEACIYYFRTEKESIDGQPLGAIPLQGLCLLLKKMSLLNVLFVAVLDSRMDEFLGETKGTKMVAIHARHRTYKLQAESVLMAEWIEKIHEAIRVSAFSCPFVVVCIFLTKKKIKVFGWRPKRRSSSSEEGGDGDSTDNGDNLQEQCDQSSGREALFERVSRRASCQ
jgi:hypothetical protein